MRITEQEYADLMRKRAAGHRHVAKADVLASIEARNAAREQSPPAELQIPAVGKRVREPRPVPTRAVQPSTVIQVLPTLDAAVVAEEEREAGRYDSVAERIYAEMLEQRRRVGEIRRWGHHDLRFVLRGGKSFTPDFRIQHLSGAIEIVEVKGFMREAAEIRLTEAVTAFPEFLWTIAWILPNGGFEQQSLPTQYKKPPSAQRTRKGKKDADAA